MQYKQLKLSATVASDINQLAQEYCRAAGSPTRVMTFSDELMEFDGLVFKGQRVIVLVVLAVNKGYGCKSCLN